MKNTITSQVRFVFTILVILAGHAFSQPPDGNSQFINNAGALTTTPVAILPGFALRNLCDAKQIRLGGTR